MTGTVRMAALAAILALGPLTAGAQSTDTPSEPDSDAATGTGPCGNASADCPRAGQGQRGGHGGGGQGMGGHGMGGHHGYRRHGSSGPTLRIVTEGRGFEIEFECNASMEECLAAIEQVYRITGKHRRRGQKDDN